MDIRILAKVVYRWFSFGSPLVFWILEVKIVKLVKDTEVYTNANEFYVSNPDVMIVKSLQEENVKLIPVKVNVEAEKSKVNSGSNEILV